MIFRIENKIFLSDVKPDMAKAVKARLTIDNPKYLEAEKMGRWIGNLEPKLRFYQETDETLVCPRGAAGQIIRLCESQDEQSRFIGRAMYQVFSNLIHKFSGRP